MKNKLKKTILCFVDHYLPGYKAGGPIQSIVNLVENLGDEFEFYLFKPCIIRIKQTICLKHC